MDRKLWVSSMRTVCLVLAVMDRKGPERLTLPGFESHLHQFRWHALKVIYFPVPQLP